MSPITLALIATILSGQDAPSQTDGSTSTQLPPVMVDGRLATMDLETRIDDFVDAVAAPVGDYGPARWEWRRPLCIAAVNFQPQAGHQMIDRVGAVALDVGLRLAAPDCRRPNVTIIATNDGAALAQALVAQSRSLFEGGRMGMDLGPEALRAFQTGERPVRWWHVSQPVDPDTGYRTTRRVGDNMDDGGNPNEQNWYPDNVAFKPFASRLYAQSRDDLRNVVIIVDVEKLGEASFSQLADYVALLSLTQVSANVDVRGHHSILSLFDTPGQVDGLTDWDRAYLRSMYSAQLNSVSQSARLGAVERDMQRIEARRLETTDD